MGHAHVSNAIARAIRDTDLTQAEVASRLGVQQGTVSKWKLGTTNPDPERFPEIERVLGMDPGTLLRELGSTSRTLNAALLKVLETEEDQDARVADAEDFAAAAGELATDMSDEDRELALVLLRQLRDRGRARRQQ